jgi:tetratricopeptide (TPR) repeat protein
MNGQQFTEALEVFEAGLKLDPNNSYLILNKSLALRELGRFDESIEAANRAMEGKQSDDDQL